MTRTLVILVMLLAAPAAAVNPARTIGHAGSDWQCRHPWFAVHAEGFNAYCFDASEVIGQKAWCGICGEKTACSVRAYCPMSGECAARDELARYYSGYCVNA